MYSTPSWPKNADRDHYRAIMRRAHPTASDVKIDQVAAALAMIESGFKCFVSVPDAYLTAATEELTEARASGELDVAADRIPAMAAIYADMNRDVDRRAA